MPVVLVLVIKPFNCPDMIIRTGLAPPIAEAANILLTESKIDY